MLAEIGLVGKAVGRYNLYAGGNREGTRIPRLFKENITEPEILEIVDGWVGNWAQNRLDDEGFGDYRKWFCNIYHKIFFSKTYFY